MNQFIRWFSEISLGDIANVGGKNASLGEQEELKLTMRWAPIHSVRLINRGQI